MRVLLVFASVAVLVASAQSQIDSASLHGRYGEPTKEVFALRPGYSMTVSYGSRHQVCQLAFQADQMDDFESSKATNKMLEAFMDDAIPITLRGSAKGELNSIAGNVGQSATEYEQLFINRLFITGQNTRTQMRMLVMFKEPDCKAIAHSG